MNSNYDLSLCVEQSDGTLLCLLKTGKMVLLQSAPVEADDDRIENASIDKLHRILLEKAGI